MDDKINKNNNILNECPVCYEDISESISFTCASFHKICFKCLLEIIDKSENKCLCVCCRGGDTNFILSRNLIDKTMI